jgi:hypothetical protein
MHADYSSTTTIYDIQYYILIIDYIVRYYLLGLALP